MREANQTLKKVTLAGFHPVTETTYMKSEEPTTNWQCMDFQFPLKIEDSSLQNPEDGDGVFNYSHNILKTGLLLRNFQDTVKEGDGARIERLC